jgi:hypothetical protein
VVFEDRARDRHALPFAAAQRESLLARHAVIAFGLRHDEVMRIREFGGCDDLLARASGVP